MSDPLLTLVTAAPSRRGRAGVVGLLVVGALAVGGVVTVDDLARRRHHVAAAVEAETAAAPIPPTPATPTRPAGEGAIPPAVGLPLLGTAGGLDLHVPAADAVVVSYHEASYPEALAVAPTGTLVANENTTRSFAVGGPDGPDYRVQVSRGRRQGPTTAVDVVLADGVEVRSPVAGVVTDVRPYELYERHEDVRLEIEPDGRPDLRVVMIHVEGVAVAVGDRVAAGDELAAGARRFPFEAVVDRATAPDRHGHVHIEVKSTRAPDD